MRNTATPETLAACAIPNQKVEPTTLTVVIPSSARNVTITSYAAEESFNPTKGPSNIPSAWLLEIDLNDWFSKWSAFQKSDSLPLGLSVSLSETVSIACISKSALAQTKKRQNKAQSGN
jgi:hypothetical protein